MAGTKYRKFIYRIDEKYRVDYVNDAWLDFAVENRAHGLSREDVLNRSIWDFIADRETRHIFDVLFKKIRASRGKIELPFRCDSPDLRRFMQMKISAKDEKHIHFENWVVREEKRPTVEILDATGRRSDELLRMCSWCKKVNIAHKQWEEIEEAVELLGLFASTPVPKFTHTICAPCSDLFWSKIDDYETGIPQTE